MILADLIEMVVETVTPRGIVIRPRNRAVPGEDLQWAY
jgi:hypothetical protein